MRLRKLIAALESDKCLNSTEFAELKRRIKQVKSYFCYVCKDKIEVVQEIISNAIVCYYVNIDDTIDIYDFMEQNELHEGVETGHVSVFVI